MQDCLENLFSTLHFDWEEKFFLLRNSARGAKIRRLQYKVWHNILIANKMLFKFGKGISSFCTFCKLLNETIIYLFHDCLILKSIWYQLKLSLSNNFSFPLCTTHSTILGFWIIESSEHLIFTHLLHIFKI